MHALRRIPRPLALLCVPCREPCKVRAVAATVWVAWPTKSLLSGRRLGTLRRYVPNNRSAISRPPGALPGQLIIADSIHRKLCRSIASVEWQTGSPDRLRLRPLWGVSPWDAPFSFRRQQATATAAGGNAGVREIRQRTCWAADALVAQDRHVASASAPTPVPIQAWPEQP